MIKELKPCAHCGGEGQMKITHSLWSGEPIAWEPHCDTFGCQSSVGLAYGSEEAAVESWNTRTPEIKQWHIVSDGDLPKPSKIVELTVEKDGVRSTHIGTIDDTSEDWFYIDESDEDCCDRTGGDDVLAWRELPEPWEEEGNDGKTMEL